MWTIHRTVGSCYHLWYSSYKPLFPHQPLCFFLLSLIQKMQIVTLPRNWKTQSPLSWRLSHGGKLKFNRRVILDWVWIEMNQWWTELYLIRSELKCIDYIWIHYILINCILLYHTLCIEMCILASKRGTISTSTIHAWMWQCAITSHFVWLRAIFNAK